MRRAEIWTVSGGAGYTGKPRPAVIIQDDHFDTDSVTLCPFTTDPADVPLFRLPIEPDQGNSLDRPSRIFVPGTCRRTTADVGRIIAAVEQIFAQHPGGPDLADGEAWL